MGAATGGVGVSARPTTSTGATTTAARRPDAARAASYSPFHFHKLFHRHFDRTPKQVITGLQIAEAQRLMAAGTPMKDVARLRGEHYLISIGGRGTRGRATISWRWSKGGAGVQSVVEEPNVAR